MMLKEGLNIPLTPPTERKPGVRHGAGCERDGQGERWRARRTLIKLPIFIGTRWNNSRVQPETAVTTTDDSQI
ncbi:hypothetical protein chiPu_0006618 [Chiloscyllium punctatum]|uniref:Uncharacterized protein n=1 Tax=Chiloscyllium punctatum TaxID=137246 RepID=A0A401SCV6_CHIPU|nr:hypothetical protein [Chiloscyllium punctatum]